MLKLKIGDQIYSIPTSWNDITYKKFCDIIRFKEGEDDKFLELLSGIPWATLKNIDQESMLMLNQLLTFVNNFDDLVKLKFTNDDAFNFDVGRETWYKLEKAKQEIKKHEKLFCAAGGLIKIYLEKEIDNEPITKVWGEINFLLDNINKFFEKYKRLSEHEEDADEFQAGVSRFEKFGFFAQCVELSRKMGKSYDDVLSMTANQIYQTFLYDYEKADYEKVLYKIKSSKR